MPSILQAVDFDACRLTADTLIHKRFDDSASLDRVLGLAMEYHRLSFTLERVVHAFLILMVAFEAMFRKETENSASKAARRVGRLLGTSNSGCGAIQRQFFDHPVHSFCKLRNGIAHGDSTLTDAAVASHHPAMHSRVTAAIIALLSLRPGQVDHAKNYYDEIQRLTDERFRHLPIK